MDMCISSTQCLGRTLPPSTSLFVDNSRLTPFTKSLLRPLVRPRGFGVLDLPSRAARETHVRPSLLDLCHGAGRSSPAAARASKLGACFSAHRARGPARATQTSKTAACAVTTPCAPCSRTACSAHPTRPHERANGSDSPFPHPRRCRLGGGRRPPCGGGDTLQREHAHCSFFWLLLGA